MDQYIIWKLKNVIGNTILKILLSIFECLSYQYNIYSLPPVISLSLTPWSLFGGLVGNGLAGAISWEHSERENSIKYENTKKSYNDMHYALTFKVF